MNSYLKRRLSLLENYVGNPEDAGTVSCTSHEHDARDASIILRNGERDGRVGWINTGPDKWVGVVSQDSRRGSLPIMFVFRDTPPYVPGQPQEFSTPRGMYVDETQPSSAP